MMSPFALAVGLILFASVRAAGTMVDVYHRGMTDGTGLSYFCFRIPVLARTTTGNLIAFAEGRVANCNDAGDVRIVRRVSNDEGLTWSTVDQVKREEGHTIGNPCALPSHSRLLSRLG